MTRVGLLECDHVGKRLLPIAGDYRDMFARLLEPHGLEVVPVDARNGVLPEAAADFDGYVITGSRSSVYDDEPWIRDLSGFVRSVAGAGVPMVGICFGHQLLAQALGGDVHQAASGWGIGPHDVALTDGRRWRLQYVHQDQVTRLPDGGEAIAASDHCPVAMLRVGDRVVGIQGHPEFPAAYVEALLDSRVERIGAEKVAAARRALTSPTDDDAAASWIAELLSSGRTRRRAGPG